MIETIDMPESLEAKIRKISDFYSKRHQWNKAKEELEECADELYLASNPFDDENMVNLTENTWSECADAIIMIAQLAMQHGKEEKVLEQIHYKVERQLERIQEQKLLLSGKPVMCSSKEEMIEKSIALAKDGIQADFHYEYDDENKLWVRMLP